MDDTKYKKTKRRIKANLLESLKDIGSTSTDSLKKDLLGQTSKDFLQSIFGLRKASGEITPGSSIEMSDILSGKEERERTLRQQLALEKRLREEEKVLSEKKSNELKLQLHALTQEIGRLTEETQSLAEETRVAAMQAPVEPGMYHIVFFEKIISFLRSFRKKINEAVIWLHASNKRAEKKNYWARYKKHGSKFFLSGEHYLTRSAG